MSANTPFHRGKGMFITKEMSTLPLAAGSTLGWSDAGVIRDQADACATQSPPQPESSDADEFSHILVGVFDAIRQKLPDNA